MHEWRRTVVPAEMEVPVRFGTWDRDLGSVMKTIITHGELSQWSPKVTPRFARMPVIHDAMELSHRFQETSRLSSYCPRYVPLHFLMELTIDVLRSVFLRKMHGALP
jgi:hypothetical protein